MDQHANNTYLEPYLNLLGPIDELNEPFLFIEVQISRQYAFTILHLPGDQEPSWHHRLEQALDRAETAGYETLTMVTTDRQYTVTLKH
jgi:hypothetical protein